ncbi:hypothetical protein [Buttiauxella sp.]|uniref:hypothetical protein n=1 Tax=Buttiauxella sp. TaxID=1972222 RepID=UPI003C718F75
MQVGLNQSGLPLATPLNSGGVKNTQAVRQPEAPRIRQGDNRFPESPLISTRPLRYNVQLNQQLTAVQQADNYLSQVESQLLQLRYAASHGSRRGELSQEAARTLTTLLNDRPQLSAGTVDRHLAVNPEQTAQVHFTLPAAQRLLQNDESETLIFSLAGQRREMVAVSLEAGATPRQDVMRLNQGLGRFGVHATLDKQQSLVFRVDETHWPQISSQLSVRGEGKRFSANEFTALIARPEPAVTDSLSQLAQQPGAMREFQGEVQQALEQLTQQRGKLYSHQDNVRRRINEMATQYQPRQALEHAQALRLHLQTSHQDYAATARALGAQANLQPGTVSNLLR